MLPYLLKAGADYNIADNSGESILHILASNGSAKVI